MAKDLDLFRAAMADVAPLSDRGRRKAIAGKPDVEGSPRPRRKSADGVPPVAVVPVAVPLSFDRAVDRSLGRGKRAPEAKLDLHGMTLAVAERAVRRFLARSAEEGLRVVLVVTGKGWRQEDGRFTEGRIRGEFPGWLVRPDNRVHVRGYKAAHARHGGGGAFYVLLRRRTRTPSA